MGCRMKSCQIGPQKKCRKKQDFFYINKIQSVDRQAFVSVSPLFLVCKDADDSIHQCNAHAGSCRKFQNLDRYQKPGQKACDRDGNNLRKHPSFVFKASKKSSCNCHTHASKHGGKEIPCPECPHIPFQEKGRQRDKKYCRYDFYDCFFNCLRFHKFLFSHPLIGTPDGMLLQ